MLRGSIPPTGLPLPFISAGSTSLLVFMSAIGVGLMRIGNQGIRIKHRIRRRKFFALFVYCDIIATRREYENSCYNRKCERVWL